MKSPAFQFYPKQWLGDDAVMLMDWDVRGMHVHLMCIAWQQTPPCSLPNDDEILQKFLGISSMQTRCKKNWEKRIKKQLLMSWREKGGRLVQEGLLKEWKKQIKNSNVRREAANKRWVKALQSNCNANADANALQLECLSSSSSSSNKKEIKNKEKSGEAVPISQVLAGIAARGGDQ